MAAVGVAGRVGVVLEQVDVAGDAFFAQATFGIDQQALEGAFAGLVVDHQLDDVVAFGRGVLGMGADVEIQPGAVAKEDVARPAPRDDAAKKITGDFVGREPSLTPKRAGHAVLVF